MRAAGAARGPGSPELVRWPPAMGPARTEHIFLYGTLQLELAPPEIRPMVARLEPVGRGTVSGRLHDLGPYPALVLLSRIDGIGEDPVRGTVYRLPSDPEVLRELDRYEGFDPRTPGASTFIRELARVTLEGAEMEAWVYLHGRDPGDAPLVPGGDYLAHRLSGRSGRDKLR